MGGNNEFFENFERKKYFKKLPSMQRVKHMIGIKNGFSCFRACNYWNDEYNLWTGQEDLKTSHQLSKSHKLSKSLATTEHAVIGDN